MARAHARCRAAPRRAATHRGTRQIVSANARSGEAHLGRQIQLLPDFPLEAPGLEKSADSGQAALDFDVHDFLRLGGRRPAESGESPLLAAATLRFLAVACDGA